MNENPKSCPSLKGFDYYKNFQSFYKLNDIIIKDEIDSKFFEKFRNEK